MAADGYSNKQIGQRLYLSPRTVGGHLYRAFPKLGISSRRVGAFRWSAFSSGSSVGRTCR